MAAAGQGTTERFTTFTAEVVYGPDTSTDTTGPVIDSVTLPRRGPSDIEIRATDAGGPIAAVILLVQPEGSDQWERRDAAEVVVKNPDGTVAERYWKVTPPVGSFRWMAQVVDSGGNVTVDSSQGHLDVAGAVAPALGDPGPAVTIPLGERLQRAVEITDGIPGERLVASTTVTDAAGSPISSAPATIQTGTDNSMRALIDQPIVSPGASTLTLSVCRGAACATASFAVDTPALNEAPIADVTLTSDTDPVQPSSILTAHATATDPEGQAVTAAYSWTRNGIAIAGQSASTLDLAGIAQPGDVIRVTVVPSDGTTPGHAASDELVVGREVVLPSAPTITATATTSQGAYTEGAWSTSPVTVAFACTAGAPLFSACPAPRTVTADTGAAGTLVTGSITDLLGRVATTSVLVRVDATAPSSHPS